MTFEEAGKMYNLQIEKIAKVEDNMHYIAKKIERGFGAMADPVGFPYVNVERKVLESIFEQLEDYKDQLQLVMKEEVSL